MNRLVLATHAFIGLTFACALSPQGHAQDSTPQPPSPPYVAALSGDFTLEKKFVYIAKGDLTPEEKALLSVPTNPTDIKFVKAGAVRKDTEHFLDNTGKEIWRVQSYRFIVDLLHPDSVDVDMLGSPNDAPDVARYHDATDFPELSWIEKNTYQGVQPLQGKPCYLYKLGDQSAWIGVDDHLPVYFASKTVQVTYTYSAAPDEPLVLPKGYAQKLEKFKRALRGQF